ncbi:MAG TPA: 1-acyl-sn-glycerol-3-phosphate acyltransferase [Gemmatimonadota bacterium]|nr:1-acyl-sn-glycerol-3-phosphate acyltransferase [Gemmatimonadota bacterium]
MMTHCLGWAVGRFYDVDRTGPPVPEGPVLIVANHPNVFVDAFVVFRIAERPARPLVMAAHFENPFFGPFLAALGALPVHRRQDDPSLMQRNEDTFQAAVAALQAGEAVQIYPEGRSHSEPALAPLRTGAARIALRAEAESDWRLGLAIVPIGLTYTRKTLFRGRALAVVGKPFGIGGYESVWLQDPFEAARRLTDEIADGLEDATLDLAEAEDPDLIETAERLYAREKGWAGWREREGLDERFPRLQAFARGLAWLRAHDPARHWQLACRVRRYRRLLEAIGAREGDVPPRYPVVGVARFVAREGSLLVLGLPVAAVGIVLWYIPYRVPRLIVRLATPESQAVATFKLVGATVAFALWFVGVLLFLGWRVGPEATLLAATLLPIVGLIALDWTGRFERDREEVRLFLRALRRGRQDRLAGYRRSLVAEFDRVLADQSRDQPLNST